MKLSKTMTRMFVEELRYVHKKMTETNDLEEKLYYFSAIYGEAQRIVNIEFDEELVFIHQVTQLVYSQIQQRILMIKNGQLVKIGLPNNLLDSLSGMVDEMAKCIENGDKTYTILEKMTILAYSTTGNGYYVIQKLNSKK